MRRPHPLFLSSYDIYLSAKIINIEIMLFQIEPPDILLGGPGHLATKQFYSGKSHFKNLSVYLCLSGRKDIFPPAPLLQYDIFCLCGCTGERLPVQDSQLQSFGNPGQDRGPCGPTNGPLRQADPTKTGFPKILVLRNNFHLQKLLMNWKLIFFILKRIFISF